VNEDGWGAPVAEMKERQKSEIRDRMEK